VVDEPPSKLKKKWVCGGCPQPHSQDSLSSTRCLLINTETESRVKWQLEKFSQCMCDEIRELFESRWSHQCSVYVVFRYVFSCHTLFTRTRALLFRVSAVPETNHLLQLSNLVTHSLTKLFQLPLHSRLCLSVWMINYPGYVGGLACGIHHRYI
jgi:hypothetical protein